MIFDRTQNDVDTAIRLISEKVKAFQQLTESEIATLEKGTMTINTLNRIESKQDELKSLFNDMGYFGCDIENKQWAETDIFDVDNFQRIIDNTNILRISNQIHILMSMCVLLQHLLRLHIITGIIDQNQSKLNICLLH